MRLRRVTSAIIVTKDRNWTSTRAAPAVCEATNVQLVKDHCQRTIAKYSLYFVLTK